MDMCALIMVRGGSKRVPNKNTKTFGHSSLLEIKINQLKQIPELKIYVNSDSDEILDVAISCKVNTIKRDPYYATDHVSINEVYENLAESVEHEHILFAHVTSPLVQLGSLMGCLETYKNLLAEPIAPHVVQYDSLATVTNIHKFLWHDTEAVNYDPENMPRSQDLPTYYMLNFAFNILPRKLMLERKNIIGKRFYPFALTELESYDVDTEEEFTTAQYIYSTWNEWFE
jgi:CMP-N-acetylneuraminic acid synthetase